MIFDCNYINDKGTNWQIKRQRSLDTQQAKTIGGADTNCDSGWSSTPSDLTKIKNCHWEPEGKKVKSISMRYWNTGFGTHSSRSTNPGQKRRDAMHMGSYRLWRNQHHYDTEASEVTRDITSGGTHHHPRHERRSDVTCQENRKKTLITVQYLDYLAPVNKSVVLAVPTRAYDSVHGSTWFQNKILTSTGLDWLPCDHRVRLEWRKWHQSLRQWHWRSQKPKMITSRTAAGARSGYTDIWINLIWRSSN